METPTSNPFRLACLRSSETTGMQHLQIGLALSRIHDASGGTFRPRPTYAPAGSCKDKVLSDGLSLNLIYRIPVQSDLLSNGLNTGLLEPVNSPYVEKYRRTGARLSPRYIYRHKRWQTQPTPRPPIPGSWFTAWCPSRSIPISHSYTVKFPQDDPAHSPSLVADALRSGRCKYHPRTMAF